jgi:hypothetical protein
MGRIQRHKAGRVRTCCGTMMDTVRLAMTAVICSPRLTGFPGMHAAAVHTHQQTTHAARHASAEECACPASELQPCHRPLHDCQFWNFLPCLTQTQPFPLWLQRLTHLPALSCAARSCPALSLCLLCCAVLLSPQDQYEIEADDQPYPDVSYAQVC